MLMEETKHLKRFLKTALGMCLIAILLSHLQVEEILLKLNSANWIWGSLGLLMASFANLVCGLRWRKIVTQLGQPLEKRLALKLYFQGITANTVLPGGIIGGDIWRIFGLSTLGMSKIFATQSVVLDRAIGLWALSTISLAAFFTQLLLGQHRIFQAPQDLKLLYLISLLCISLSPALLWWMNSKWVRGMFWPSVIALVSQLFTVSTFLCCLKAFGVDVSTLAVVILCTGIFLGSVVPASIGGFGSREIVSVFLLASLGIQAEVAFLASVLFGLTDVTQGIFALPSWLFRKSER